MKSACTRCQRLLPQGHAGGNCPSCLFDSALCDAPFHPAPESEWEDVPRELGDYEILGEVGRGGTSIVYRARQRRLNRIVALKTLHGTALNSRDAFERLQTEARAVARLDHPHIVPLYEVGRYAGAHFLTLRFYEHGSLAEALRGRTFTSAESARFVALAARAVHYAHSRGVLHRDLKPSNFLLDEHGAPHIVDFGLAKLADSETSLTLSTSVLGTPAYMAPEQAAGNAKEAGTSADIYSLGAVLFELLTGRAPFLGRSALEVLRLVADAEPPRPSILVPGLDRDLEAVCLQCLEKDPGRRYESAASLAEDLERWLRQEPLSIRPVSTRERAVKWVRRRPLIASLMAVSAMAVLMGLVGITWQWTRAKAAAREARRNVYVAEMNAASLALEKQDWGTIHSILERTRPQPGEADLRGWEWRYLWGVSRSDATRRFGNGDREIVSIAALPDGHTVALGEKEGGFSLWDTQTGRRSYEFPEPINRISAAHFPLNRVVTRVAMVPGSRRLAYSECLSENESQIRLWNIDSQTVERSLPLPGVPRDMAVSPNGRWLACSTLQGDRHVHVYDLATGKLARSIPAKFTNRAVGNPLAFSPDSTWIAFEAEGGENADSALIRVVDLASGNEIHRFDQGQFAIVSLTFSPDGRWLVSGGAMDRPLLRIWDLQSGRLAQTLKGDGQSAVAFSPEGRRLFIGLDIWRVPEFTRERSLAGESADVSVNCLLGDGSTYLTANGATVLQWDLNSTPRPRQGVLLSVPLVQGDYLPDGQGCLFISTNHLAYKATAPHYSCQPLPSLGTNCTGIEVLGSLHRSAVGHGDGRVTFHDLHNLRLLGELPAGGRPVARFWWLEKFGLLAVIRRLEETSGTETIEVWDMRTLRRTWETETEPWMWRDTRSEATGILWQIFADGRLVGHDLVNHRVEQRHLGPGTHTGAAFSPDGQYILDTIWGGQRLIDFKSMQPLRTLGTLKGTSASARIWPDGSRWLLTNCRIVDPETGRLLLELESPFGNGHLPSLSRDGSQVSLHSDALRVKQACIWRAPSWDEIRREEATTTN